MAWKKVKPPKKTPPPEVTHIKRPLRMIITPEESLRRMEYFMSEEGKQRFVDSVRNGTPYKPGKPAEQLCEGSFHLCQA